MDKLEGLRGKGEDLSDVILRAAALESATMIRQATAADAATVHAMLWEARDEIPLTSNFDDDDHRKWVLSECDQGSVLVFERDGVIAGALIIHDAELLYLATSLAHRRSGVAAALVEDAKTRVWKYSSVALARTRTRNAPAIQLLEKHGFVFDRDRTDIVGGPDAVWFTATRSV